VTSNNGVMARLRLFAGAREVAGTSGEQIEGATVGAVLDAAVERFGEEFARLLPTCRVWCNGEEATRADPVTVDDEVAVLPPVSGGDR